MLVRLSRGSCGTVELIPEAHVECVDAAESNGCATEAVEAPVECVETAKSNSCATEVVGTSSLQACPTKTQASVTTADSGLSDVP